MAGDALALGGARRADHGCRRMEPRRGGGERARSRRVRAWPRPHHLHAGGGVARRSHRWVPLSVGWAARAESRRLPRGRGLASSLHARFLARLARTPRGLTPIPSEDRRSRARRSRGESVHSSRGPRGSGDGIRSPHRAGSQGRRSGPHAAPHRPPRRRQSAYWRAASRTSRPGSPSRSRGWRWSRRIAPSWPRRTAHPLDPRARFGSALRYRRDAGRM